MGYTIRAGNYRYTRCQKYENPAEVVASELYDHSEGKTAFVNLAGKQEFKKVVKKLDKLMSGELKKYKLLKPAPLVNNDNNLEK